MTNDKKAVGSKESLAAAIAASILGLMENVVAEQISAAMTGQKSSPPAKPKAPKPASAPKASPSDELMLGFYIVQAICAKIIDPKRVSAKINAKHISIILNENSHKQIACVGFDVKKNLQLTTIFGKKSDHKPIQNMSDIYKFTKEIETRVKQLHEINI